MYPALRASLGLFKFNPIEFSPASAGMTRQWDNSDLDRISHQGQDKG